MKRIVLSLVCLFTLSIYVFGEVYSLQEPIRAHHWIYDAMFKMNSECQKTSVLDNAPLTVQELYSNFLLIEKEELSEAGQALYEQAEAFFQKKKFIVDFDNIKFTTGLVLNPAAAFKTNNDIDWSMASSYTHKNEGNCINAAQNTLYTTGVATIPLLFDFDDTICIDFEPYIGTTYWSLTNKNWAMNIPTTINQEDWMFTPSRAFGSVGKNFGNWGINAQIGVNGLEIGRSKTGSVIYNTAFQTDSFLQLNLYSPRIKYNLDFVQIDIKRNFYLHYFEIIPTPKFKLGIAEGTMVNGPVELKWFNPLVIMHHYLGWRLYKLYADPDEARFYGEMDFCAYLAISMDYTPCKYLRLYLLYGQDELQDFQESLSDLPYTQSFPDSFAVQFGAEVNVPYNKGYFIGNFEGIYSTPFCYIKQTKEASLIRIREYLNYPTYGLGNNASWIGTQFGPDALGCNLSFGYEQTNKWKAELTYLFLAHGTNSVNIFDKTWVYTDPKTGEEKVIYGYYPPSMLLQGVSSDVTKAMTTKELTGIIQYTNRIGVNGEYYFTDKMSIGGNLLYTFIFNHRAVEGSFAQGLECTVNFKYDIF